MHFCEGLNGDSKEGQPGARELGQEVVAGGIPELIRSGEGVGVRMRQLGGPQSSGWGEQGTEAEKGTVYRFPALRVWQLLRSGAHAEREGFAYCFPSGCWGIRCERLSSVWG